MKNFKLFSLALLFFVGSVNAQQMIISKVFYAGTTKAGATTNYTGGEEYIELHNNSGNEIDIAGYYIGLIESEAADGAYLAADQTNYEVKLKQVFQFPDNKPIMVAPWSNILIAACAIDHSAVAQNGPDLSKADFTFGNMAGDNPDIPALSLVFSFNSGTKAINLTNGGDAGVILIKKSNGKYIYADDQSKWVYANGKTKGSQYLPFNTAYALDCVEILKTKQTDGVYSVDPARKRLSDTRDKGYVPADKKMMRDGFVAYRKTAVNNNGNKMLYDTDNSCVDFLISGTITPKEYDDEESGVTEVRINIPESGYLPFNADKYFFTPDNVYVSYVSISKGELRFNHYPGRSVIASNSPYILVGSPGEHTIYYTEAQRTLATAGADNWISDTDEKYKDGVLTVTTRNRFPMKFVNEKGNVRFVRDCIGGNNQTLRIDVEKEGRFYINLTTFDENEVSIPWGGITPDEVSGVRAVIPASADFSDDIYNLQGMKVDAEVLSPGIYIRNGKKFIVK